MSLVTCHMSLTTTARPTVCPSAKSPTMQNCPVCKDQQTLNLLFLWAILAPSEQKLLIWTPVSFHYFSLSIFSVDDCEVKTSENVFFNSFKK